MVVCYHFLYAVLYYFILSCLNDFLVSMFVIGVISIEVWPTQFPVWAFVLSLAIGGCPKRIQLSVFVDSVFPQRSFIAFRLA